jgi:hypothetical protein
MVFNRPYIKQLFSGVVAPVIIVKAMPNLVPCNHAQQAKVESFWSIWSKHGRLDDTCQFKIMVEERAVVGVGILGIHLHLVSIGRFAELCQHGVDQCFLSKRDK